MTIQPVANRCGAVSDIDADVIRLAIGHYRGRMSDLAQRLGTGRPTL
jgi:DNA-binding NtrC family response regulator